ncbi:Rieske (2Fe-2S) protein [Streptomyces meridianus]|uniref:Cytochrome bc1 complex Rieske iron-sulfur subunit n=1 Tax=Streptomyces meridianus TaxID=2938945 RepID=A0ABT0X4H8_9ACTN|nr:Rieske (2Fe-2S) protein [Streptomyces meridianus]MCM2577450.1 Rieske (2Fe-2S) protein [Streptomyces meridianus]
MTESQETEPALCRRAVVAVAGAAGLTAALAACGASGEGGQPEDSPSRTGGSSDPGTTGGGALTSTGDIPEGGGKIFADEKIVVTQPSAGEFRAFSAVCTHAGCIVSSVGDGTVNCACHGSRFSIDNGSVEHGPATKPLPAEKITVKGDSITRG